MLKILSQFKDENNRKLKIIIAKKSWKKRERQIGIWGKLGKWYMGVNFHRFHRSK